MTDSFPITDRNRVRRRSQRGNYDRETVHAILDETHVCHVGFSVVIAIAMEEASAKIRKAGVVDEEEDYALPHWAGVIPLSLQPQKPVPDPRLATDIQVPDYVERWIRSVSSRPW